MLQSARLIHPIDDIDMVIIDEHIIGSDGNTVQSDSHCKAHGHNVISFFFKSPHIPFTQRAGLY